MNNKLWCHSLNWMTQMKAFNHIPSGMRTLGRRLQSICVDCIAGATKCPFCSGCQGLERSDVCCFTGRKTTHWNPNCWV